MHFLIVAAEEAYLYTRNTRCAIFPVNPRQTLKKQEHNSMGVTGQLLPMLAVCTTHILPLYANYSLRALDTSAALRNINTVSVFAVHIRITVPPQAPRRLIFSSYLCCHVDNKMSRGEETLGESPTLSPLSPASPGGP